MSDLVTRLRGGSAPVAKLLGEAADELMAAQARIAELTETLRSVVEMSNTQRSRDFAEVKRTLAKARELLASSASASRAVSERLAAATPAALESAVSVPPLLGAHESVASATPAAAAIPESVTAAKPVASKSLAETTREDDVVTGMFNEIRNFLRNPAESSPRAR